MAQKPTRPKSAQKQAAPPAAEPQPSSELPKMRSPLSPFQEHLRGLAGDLILHGGHDDELGSLIYACMGHEWRRKFPWQDSSKQQEDVAEYTNKRHDDWKRKLARNWPEKPLPGEEPKKSAPAVQQSVSDLIRSNVRDDLREKFEEFMRDAGIEEIFLLRDVLAGSENSHGFENQSVAIAEEFSYQIGRHADYIRVPYRHQKLVEQYLELLEKGEEGRAA